MSRGRAKFTEADVGRVLKAAAKAGVEVRLEIQPNGTMVVTSRRSGEPIEASAGNEWDDAYGAIEKVVGLRR
jgi:hypothetical protein